MHLGQGHSGTATLSIFVPLYNEAEFIQTILERIIRAPLPAGLEREIIVVDDASTDGSAELVDEVATRYPGLIRLIRCPRNRGKGAAVRVAIEHAGGDYCLIQDADLEYDPQEYRLLLEPLLDGSADVVYGSRFLSAGRRRVLYYWHSVANHALTTLCNIISNLNLTDMETCYKAFRVPLLKSILDLSPVLTQPVKTQNPFKGELSHGIVEKDVHQGVQAGGGAAVGTRGIAGRGGSRAGSEPERAAPLAA